MKSFLFQLASLIFFVHSTAVAQVPDGLPSGMEGLYQQQQGNKLAKEYKLVRANSVLGAGIKGMGAQYPEPIRVAFESGEATVLVIKEEYIDYCPNDTDYTAELTAWVLKMDPDNLFNAFYVNPTTKRASLHIRGKMEKYVPGKNYCLNNEMVLAETGIGSMDVDFSTINHVSPRQFMVMEQGSVNDSEAMKQLKDVQKFWRANLLPYLKYVAAYQAKPHVRIGGNGTNQPPPPPNQRKQIEAGTEDEGDGDGKGSWKSTRDGFGYAGTAVQALSKSLDIMDFAEKGAQLFGAATKMKNFATKASLEFLASAANLAGFSPNGMAEDQINATIDQMVAAMAEVNKKYAASGNPAAQEIQRRSKLPVKDSRYYKEGIDASYLVYQINDMFNALDKMDDELEDMDLPKSAVGGTIYGPGLSQRLMSLRTEGQPIINVGNSAAMEEGLSMAGPDQLKQLQDLGVDIPEEILEMDINGLLEEAQSKMDGKVDMDLKAPLFNGILSTTRFTTLKTGSKVQNYQIIFAVGSPKTPLEFSWLDANTIFDHPTVANNDGKPKQKTLYVAIDGNDSNPGTKTAPFATLQKAMDASLVFLQGNKPVSIIVKDGEYRQSSKVTWPTLGMGMLTIEAENKHGAIFYGTEDISELTWIQDKVNGYYFASNPLHPQQWSYTPGGNPLENPAPVLVVNGKQLTHFPASQLPPGMQDVYIFSGTKVIVAPPQGVNLNDASVATSVRKFAIEITGGGQVAVKGLRFPDYPFPVPNNTPGIKHSGNVSAVGCKFN
ncbi:MAG TPA: DUF1565 domain-containing protein [Flavobacteriaceae bacterium]|mgnify:CR=1 FL=1|nr:DUF1565 domain-containing protein [Flavobacteriaceae bacterium]HPF10799.1 DUF1565 domain-containing protein [Flavobacteriaceae bacterium]HQU20992.1 DUF1565 domain-containing protein [Flavobacteriaceae bacterium]HQU66465.1 DUF1565 domain-containing protein [Flavobacteriaceae bacterium]HRW44544.1 DUF1565 domain-containing protein [Flavobacteriaceae bacterium]